MNSDEREMDKDSGKPKGDATLSYEEPICAKAAVEHFDGVVVTKTLLGGWSVTSAKLPNLRAWVVVLLSPQVVTEAEVDQECAEAEVWTVVGLQESEAQVDPVVSVVVGEVTVVDSEDVAAWTEEGSVEPDVEDRPWTEWVAEGEEEWDHLVARWI
ncbi:hypothetical protein GOODEAATRI_013712 [Goodea atripinnis]|uniref:Uncharacterized protein n=1 Tax=Goodea atripinnis TaxID=208336 RepID=A0ABV0MRU3_9TELE